MKSLMVFARWTARSVAIEVGREWNTDYEKLDEENINRFDHCVKKYYTKYINDSMNFFRTGR